MARTASRRPAHAGALFALFILLAAPALPGAAGGVAFGHAQLVASSPSAGEIVASAPTELSLVFSEPLEAEFTSADVSADDGSSIVERGGAVEASDRFELVVPLPALADGIYVVRWRTLSAADGHTAEGMFSFGIGDTGGTVPSSAGHSTHAEGDLFDTAGRWLTYAGLFAAFGVPTFLRFVLRVATAPRPLRTVAWLLTFAAAATLALAIRAALESGGSVFDYLLASRNGQLQIARAAVLTIGAAAVLALAGRRTGSASVLAAVTAGVGIALLVAAGHAAAQPTPVAIVVQAVHVAAAAIWLGGVASLLVLLVRPGLLGVDREAVPMSQALPRFSALALGAIGLVAATGAYAAWSETGTIDWLASEYGRTLALKVALALAALSIGALNFFDGGRNRPWLGGLQMRLGVEVGLALVILVVTASLSRTPPSADEQGVALTPLPDAFGEIAPGITLSLLPGRPGVNQAQVTGTGAIGSLPAQLTLDRLDAPATTQIELTPVDATADGSPMPSMDHATMPAPSTASQPAWTGSAIILPAGSAWDANVRILSSDGEVELIRQRFTFTMGDDGVAEGRLDGLVDPLGGIAVVLLVGGTLAVGLGAGGWRLPRTDGAASRVALLAGGVTGASLGLLIGASQLLSG